MTYADILREDIERREREIQRIKLNASLDDEEKDIMIEEIQDEIDELKEELEDERMTICLSQGLSRYC